MKSIIPGVLFGLTLGIPIWAEEPLAEQPWFSGPLEHFLDVPEPVALGWSWTGRVALIVPSAQGLSPSPRVLVVDAVDDHILFDAVIPIERNVSAEQKEQWVRNAVASDTAQNFLQVCMAEGVQPQSPRPMGISMFPFLYDDRSVNASVVADSKGSRIVMSIQGRGLKTVTSHRSAASSTTIIGYFLSPFEPRLLLVYTLNDEAWPGYQFAGSHLRVGFSKPLG